MNILYTASEALPFIASGGLADVAGSLPAAINAEGHDCRVVIPYYSSIRQELKDKLTYVTNFTVPVAWRNQYCGVFTGVVNGVTYYLLDNEYYFQRNGLYGFYDDAERFIFFSRAVLKLLRTPMTGRRHLFLFIMIFSTAISRVMRISRRYLPYTIFSIRDNMA